MSLKNMLNQVLFEAQMSLPGPQQSPLQPRVLAPQSSLRHQAPSALPPRGPAPHPPPVLQAGNLMSFDNDLGQTQRGQRPDLLRAPQQHLGDQLQDGQRHQQGQADHRPQPGYSNQPLAGMVQVERPNFIELLGTALGALPRQPNQESDLNSTLEV